MEKLIFQQPLLQSFFTLNQLQYADLSIFEYEQIWFITINAKNKQTKKTVEQKVLKG